MITLTQGDTDTWSITAKSSASTDGLMDLTGATLETHVKGADGTVVVIPSDHHTLLDQVASKGKFQVTIDAAVSLLFKEGAHAEFITRATWSLSGNIKTFRCKGQLIVVPAEPNYFGTP